MTDRPYRPCPGETSRRPAAGAVLAAAAVSTMLCAAPGRAAQTEIVPRLDVGALHETNPRLSRVEENEATGLVLDGRLAMSWRTPRTRLFFDPRLQLRRYSEDDDQDLEDDNVWLNTGLEHNSERSQTSLIFRYSEIGIRTSELETASDVPGGSGDLLFVDDTQTRWGIEPSWSYQLGQLNTLRVSGGYSDISYDKNKDRITGRFDYTYLFVDASWEHSFTPRLGLGIQLNASEFNSENPAVKNDPVQGQGLALENDSTTYGGSLFMNYAFSERLTGSIYGGARTTEIELERAPFIGADFFQTPPDLDARSCTPPFLGIFLEIVPPPCTEEFEGDNFVGQLQLSREGERTVYDFSVSRVISPNSNGAETLRDELRLTLNHDFSRRMDTHVGLLYYQQEDAAVETERDRDYLSLNAHLDWRMSEQWVIRGAYRFVWVEDTFTAMGRRNAENHYFFVSLSYRPTGWRWP